MPDGSIDLVVSGGTAPYSFLWSNTFTTEDLSGLISGTYSVHVEDASATPLSADLSVTLVDPPLLSVDVVPDPILCFGEESRNSYANASGGTPPYDYLWSSGYNPDQNPVNGLLAGSHSVLVTDNNGCAVNTSFSISQPTGLSISVSSPLNSWGFNVTCGERDGIIEGIASGGTLPYSFSCFGSVSGASWTSNNPYFNNLGDEEFEVKVIDANLCTAVSFIILITDNPCPGKYWYTIGNAGINPSNNFLGTTDTSSLVFRTNNAENARIINNGNVGIGVSLPVKALHVFTTHEQGFIAGPNESYSEANYKPSATTTSMDEEIKVKYRSEFLSPPSSNDIGHEMNIYGPPVLTSGSSSSPAPHHPEIGLSNGIRQGIRLENLETNTGAPFCAACPTSMNSVWDLEPLVSNKGTMFGITAIGANTSKQILTLLATERVGINNNDPHASFSVNKDRSVNLGSYGGQGSPIYGEYIGFNTILSLEGGQQKLVKLKTGTNGTSGGGQQRGGAIIAADYYGNLSFQMYDPDILAGPSANAHSVASCSTNFAPQITFTAAGQILSNGQQISTEWLQTPSGNGTYYSNATGKIGIGTNNPEEKLHVVGDARVSGVLKCGNSIYINGTATPGSGTVDMITANTGVLAFGGFTTFSDIKVSIGTTNSHPDFMLQVCGPARANRVVVEQNWCDFVFEKDYPLASLAEVEEIIKKEKHLPGIPSEKEIIEKGLDLGKLSALQMQKIEELYLYIIEQEKEIKKLKNKISFLNYQK